LVGYGADKLVQEVHNYENSISSCDTLKGNLNRNGFEAMDGRDVKGRNVMPVMMTEFGFQMEDVKGGVCELLGRVLAGVEGGVDYLGASGELLHPVGDAGL
jgi:hypothetical protein